MTKRIETKVDSKGIEYLALCTCGAIKEELDSKEYLFRFEDDPEVAFKLINEYATSPNKRLSHGACPKCIREMYGLKD